MKRFTAGVIPTGVRMRVTATARPERAMRQIDRISGDLIRVQETIWARALDARIWISGGGAEALTGRRPTSAKISNSLI